MSPDSCGEAQSHCRQIIVTTTKGKAIEDNTITIEDCRKKYKYKPVQQSSSSDEELVTRFQLTGEPAQMLQLASISVDTQQAISAGTPQKQQKQRKNKTICKKGVISKRRQRSAQSLLEHSLRQATIWLQTSERFSQLTLEHKKQSYEQITNSLRQALRIIFETKQLGGLRTIIVQGPSHSGRKTAVFNAIQTELRLVDRTIRTMFYSCQQKTRREYRKTIKGLSREIKCSATVLIIIVVVSEQLRCYSLDHFLSGLFGTIRRLGHIAIGILESPFAEYSSNFTVILFSQNNKNFFRHSLERELRRLEAQGLRVQVTTRLLNYLCLKLQNAHALGLNYLRLFIDFLQSSGALPLVVTADTIDVFLRENLHIPSQTLLTKLPIHEQMIVTGAYLQMKEQPEMFMPVRDLCRNYHIVAKHLRVEPKCYSKFLKSLTMLLTYGVFGLAAVDQGKRISDIKKVFPKVGQLQIQLALQSTSLLGQIICPKDPCAQAS